jgi:hypothetical protein
MAQFTDIAAYLRDKHLAALNVNSMAALGSVVSAGQRVDVVITSFDEGLLHRAYSPAIGGWTSWQARGGAWASRAAVVSHGEDSIDVFGLGLDGLLYDAYFDGNLDDAGDWPITGLGGPGGDRLSSRPAVIVDGSAIRVFVRGEESHLWSLTLDAVSRGVTSGWQSMEHELAPFPGIAYGPAAASWGPGRLDLFVVDHHSSLLRHTYSTPQGYGPEWEVLGSVGNISSVDATAWPASETDGLGGLYAVSCYPQGSLLGPGVNVTAWLGRHWEQHPMVLPGAIADACITSWGKPRLDVFYVGVADGGSYAGGPYEARHVWSNTGLLHTPNNWIYGDTLFDSPYPVLYG